MGHIGLLKREAQAHVIAGRKTQVGAVVDQYQLRIRRGAAGLGLCSIQALHPRPRQSVTL